MEQRKKIFGALDDLMRSPIGDRLRERVFRELSTKEIHDLLQREQKPYKELMAYYQCALMEVETKFRVLNEQFSLAHDRNPIESIKTRVKSLESITEKLNRRNLPFSTQSIEENLTDIAGIRIICSFREDIYFLADCLLEQDDITLIQRKDYIENPKENGYRSLHLIVEVPIFLEHKKKMTLAGGAADVNALDALGDQVAGQCLDALGGDRTVRCVAGVEGGDNAAVFVDVFHIQTLPVRKTVCKGFPRGGKAVTEGD